MHAVALAALVWGTAAQANFLAAEGFSGRRGVTCAACHNSPHPLAAPAVLEVTGLPAAWEPGAAYGLEATVRGGPDPVPGPLAGALQAPRGGLEAEADQGRLLPAGGALRSLGPAHLTYTQPGTQARSWSFTWQAPAIAELAAPPGEATLWLAGLAASGNHLVAANTSDGGERLDAPTNGTWRVPPAPAAWLAWNATPLVAPRVDAPAAVPPHTMWAVEGRQADGNATAVRWRLDGAPWQQAPARAHFRIELAPIGPGTHVVEVAAMGAGRHSDAVRAEVRAQASGGREAPALPAALPAVVLVGVAALAARAAASGRHWPGANSTTDPGEPGDREETR